MCRNTVCQCVCEKQGLQNLNYRHHTKEDLFHPLMSSLISFTQRPKDTEHFERCQKVCLIMVLFVTKKVIKSKSKSEWYNDMQKPFLLS